MFGVFHTILKLSSYNSEALVIPNYTTGVLTSSNTQSRVCTHMHAHARTHTAVGNKTHRYTLYNAHNIDIIVIHA